MIYRGQKGETLIILWKNEPHKGLFLLVGELDSRIFE